MPGRGYDEASRTTHAPPRLGPVGRAARALLPGYFALVMATGATAVAADMHGLDLAAWSLLVVNVVAYAVLGILTGVRAVRFPDAMIADLQTHAKARGFSRSWQPPAFSERRPWSWPGLWPWPRRSGCSASALWVAVMYTFFLTVITRVEKSDLTCQQHADQNAVNPINPPKRSATLPVLNERN